MMTTPKLALRGIRPFGATALLTLIVLGCGPAEDVADMGSPGSDVGPDQRPADLGSSCPEVACPDISTRNPTSCECECPNTMVLTHQEVCAEARECAVDNGGCDPVTTCEGGRCGLCPTGYLAGSGESACIVDPTMTPDLTIAIDEVARDGASAEVTFTVTNHGAAWAGGDVGLAFYDELVEAPTFGEVGGDLDRVTLPALATNESTTSSMGVYRPSTADQGQAWLVVDVDDDVLEGDETNNVSGAFSWGIPNLRIELLGVTVTRRDNVRADVAIINEGAAPVARGSYLRVGIFTNARTVPTLTDGADRSSIIQLGSRLDAYGGRLVTSIDYYSSATGGQAYVRVNDDGALQESTRDDNLSEPLFWGWRDRPNLRVVVDSVTRINSTSAEVAYTVINDGTRPVSTSSISVARMNASTPPATQDFPGGFSTGITEIPAGGTASGMFTSSIFTEGTGTLYLYIDSARQVSEVYEGDNISPGFEWGVGIPYPDLRVRVDGIREDGGGVATLSYTLFNDGSAAVDASAFDVEYFENRAGAPDWNHSGDATISPAAGTIPAGGQVSRSSSVPSRCLVARSYLYADPGRVVVEENEANNVSAQFREPGPAERPDLRVRLDDVLTDELGNLIRIYYTVFNDGPGASDGCELTIYYWVGATTTPVPGDADGFFRGLDTTTIAPGSSRSGSFSVSGIPGRSLILIVNSEETIPEVTISNNVSAETTW